MNHHLGKLLASLFGALLLAIAGAASASAQEFHADISNPTLKASAASGSTFNVNGKTIKCTASSYEGSASTATVTNWTLFANLGNCVAFGFSTGITSGGCDFVLSAGGESGNLRLNCPSGNTYTFTATFLGSTVCIIRIKPQATGTTVSIANAGSGSSRDITFAASLSGLEYSEDPGGFCEVGSGSNGTFEGGSPTLKGFNGSNVQIGVWRA